MLSLAGIALLSERFTMSVPPRVTVFIPAYNREYYIRSAIDSILQQSFRDFELLIVDDGSTDGTVDAIQSYDDPRIRLAHNGANLGIPASRNHGLRLARGEYIALLDSDDFAYPWRLARQVAFLDRHRHIAQVGSWCTLMNSNGDLLPRVRRHPSRPSDVDVHLLFHCSLINRTVMARTAILRTFGYDESFPRCQDYELHGRLAERHAIANMSQLLVCGREHDGRITRNTKDIGKDRKMAIQGRLLERLGVHFSTNDLEQHYLLTQKPQKHRDSDTHLDWTEAWLNRLLDANRRSQRYDPAALQRVVALIWASCCWFDRSAIGRHWALKAVSKGLSRGLPQALTARWLLAAAVPKHRRALRDTGVQHGS